MNYGLVLGKEVRLIFILQGPVIVEGDLEMEVDNTVDGVDVSELDRNTLKLYGEETIEGFIVSIVLHTGIMLIFQVLIIGVLILKEFFQYAPNAKQVESIRASLCCQGILLVTRKMF